MRLKFCGANHFVTGSCHLLTLDSGLRVLMDCGLYQGNDKNLKEFNRQWHFDPKSIDIVILSHAHIDHSGRLPRLVRDGFRGQIYCTHATRSLCSIMLLDSARIQERDAEYKNKRRAKRGSKNKKVAKPLYTTKDVAKTMTMFCGMPYNTWLQIHKEVGVQFRDAGHILGSSNVTLRIRENGVEKLFGFTGDIGRPNRPILRDPQALPKVDYLICESTYGDKDHDGAPQSVDKLLKVIHNTCFEKRGKLIIPAFSVGRTQELVYLLDQLETAGKLPRVPIYVDSPLAVNATQIFGAHPECYDSDLNEYLLVDPNPFGFNDLTYIRNVEVSKSLNTSDTPCIIISSSGMMNAGRVKHHLYNNIDNPRSTFLIVGYCSPSTPGGMLLNGIEEIKLFGERKPVRADVVRLESLSAHGDRHEMLDHIRNQKKLKNLFLVHGELDSKLAFKKLLKKNGFANVETPQLGQQITLSK